ncbi:MAG: thiamine phosphate synthase [Alistipes sp.]
MTDAPLLVTLPRVLKSEVETLAALCRSGAGPIHIRKPDSSAAEVERLLRDLCAAGVDMDRFTLHYDEPLARRYGLGGVHLRGERIAAGAGEGLRRSCSTHSWDEAERYGPVADYVFLSPLFDSISKAGYRSAVSLEEARSRLPLSEGASSRWAESARKISHGPAWPVSTELRRSAPSGSRRATGSMRRLPCPVSEAAPQVAGCRGCLQLISDGNPSVAEAFRAAAGAGCSFA